jgi:multicomponent Na+:H+ antiporter subunit E
VHALHVTTPDDVQRIRRDVRRTEAWLIRVMGSKAELAALRGEIRERN